MNQGFSYSFDLMIEGSGARSGRIKNIQIRIRNTCHDMYFTTSFVRGRLCFHSHERHGTYSMPDLGPTFKIVPVPFPVPKFEWGPTLTLDPVIKRLSFPRNLYDFDHSK
jgi:hypothetical protein